MRAINPPRELISFRSPIPRTVVLTKITPASMAETEFATAQPVSLWEVVSMSHFAWQRKHPMKLVTWLGVTQPRVWRLQHGVRQADRLQNTKLEVLLG